MQRIGHSFCKHTTPFAPILNSWHQVPRRYVNRFSGYEVCLNPTEKKEDYNLTLHEEKHINVVENSTTLAGGILTSSKKNSSTGEAFIKISPKKFDGSFTPKKDKNTGEHCKDNEGNTLPDETKGGQYFGPFSQLRRIDESAKRIYKKRSDIQAYLDEHENQIAKGFDSEQHRNRPSKQ